MDHYMSRTPHFVSLGFCWNFILVSLLPLPVLCLVAQVYLTLCHSIHCCLPGSSVHGDSPGKNTRVGCHALHQGIFPTQGSNPGLLHCRRILYRVSYQGSPLFQKGHKNHIFQVSCYHLQYHTKSKNNECQVKTVFLSIKKQLKSKHSFPLLLSFLKIPHCVN